MKQANTSIPSWKIRLFWILLASGFVLGFIVKLDRPEPGINIFPRSGFKDTFSQKEAIRFCVYRVLFDFGIRVDWISGDSHSKTVRIPKDLAPVLPYSALATEIRRLGGEVLKGESNPAGDQMTLEAGFKGEFLYRVTLLYDPDLERQNGEIAIVIDDFGYSVDSEVNGFLGLHQSVTFSIIPGLEESQEVAMRAFEAGREVLIHMPMEPENGHYEKDDYILLTGMSEEEIKSRVRKAIHAVPNARGLNNHMGSKATLDPPLLSALMQELRASDLFFLDSRTHPKSIAYSVARKMQIPCAKNETFLDSIEEEPYIRQQVYLLADLAAKHGSAIGIGHPKKLTLHVLQQELPNLEKRGFRFVPISQVVK